MQYRKKPVTIEAIRYTGDNLSEIEEFTNQAVDWTDGQLTINTLEGVMTAAVGDYIIRGVKGEFYPCKPDIFKMTYEANNSSVNDSEILEIIKQYMSTTFSGEIVVDCKQKNPMAYQKLVQFISANK